MNDSLLMLQLVFNLVMLVAIILISRTPQPAPARRSRATPRGSTATASKPATAPKTSFRDRVRARRARRVARRAAAPDASPSATPAHLEDLVARTERTELVAEQVLRERLARLGHASGGGR